MKNLSKIFYALFLLPGVIACDDTTDTLGIYTSTDNITTAAAVFQATSSTLIADSVLSNNSFSYLGRITDPETGLKVEADFLAQFATLENYSFPKKEWMMKDESDNVYADSIEIRLYYEDFYGEEDNPMRLQVYELDKQNPIREDSSYYSNANLENYINQANTLPICEKMFTARDFTISDDDYNSSSYVPNVRIVLPTQIGTDILRKYYENPDYFANSYEFIRNVCPGFYFKIADGEGTMLKAKVGAMNLFFRYHDANEDSTFTGVARFAATPEVLQNTSIINDDMEELVDNNKDVTFLKTPAGLFTQVTLPIDDIYKDHATDSISQAQITFFRYNVENMDNAFNIPQTLLMVRKKDIISFFENRSIPDGVTSFYTTLNSTYNTYTFSNIANLVSAAYNEKKASGMSESQWLAAHPDWDKVVLIPVELNTDNSSNVISVNHDMGLSSTKLVGGEGSTIQMQVIYSAFK